MRIYHILTFSECRGSIVRYARILMRTDPPSVPTIYHLRFFIKRLFPVAKRTTSMPETRAQTLFVMRNGTVPWTYA